MIYTHEWLIQVQWIHSPCHPFIFCTPWEDIPIIQGNTCLSDPWHCCYFILLPRHYICAALVFMSRSNLFEIFSKDGLRIWIEHQWQFVVMCIMLPWVLIDIPFLVHLTSLYLHSCSIQWSRFDLHFFEDWHLYCTNFRMQTFVE